MQDLACTCNIRAAKVDCEIKGGGSAGADRGHGRDVDRGVDAEAGGGVVCGGESVVFDCEKSGV